MDDNKIVVYETFIKDMLNAFDERYNELCGKKELSEFEQGRKLAYWEILEIIKVRKDMIAEILSED